MNNKSAKVTGFSPDGVSKDAPEDSNSELLFVSFPENTNGFVVAAMLPVNYGVFEPTQGGMQNKKRWALFF